MYIRPDRVAAVSERELFRQAADYAADFLETLDTRSIRAEADVEELIAALGGQLPELGLDPRAVIASLVEAAEPGVVANASGRYFGFVVGGGVPAALAADWLASAWDQNAAFYVMGPSAAVVEEVCRGWLAEPLGLPLGVSGAFVSGCQMAHVTALAAARHHVLAQAGWDVVRDGLAGSPPIQVVVGEQRHVTIDRALRLLGIGSSSLVVLPADDQGRMRVDELRLTAAPTIVCGQAGEGNTGALDDGRAQVAQRAVRLGARLLRAPRFAPRRDGRDRVVSRPLARTAAARPDAMDARGLAARARLRRLRGDPLARPFRHCRARRALLRQRAPVRRGARGRRR